MTDQIYEQARLQKAIVQKLESLHRSGVRTFPRTNVAAPVPASPAKSAATPSRAAAQPARNTQPSPGLADSVAKAPPAKPSSQSQPPKSTAPTTPKPAASAPQQPATPQVPSTAPFASPPMSPADRSGALQILADEVTQCTLCSELVTSRTQTVFGVGDPNARLVFFGEAPGADEDRQGEPFVGKAGQLLTKIIEACKMKREDVYIMNVLRCRPPGNRNPTPEEAQNCRPFFERQFEIVRPEFVVCLGSIAATTLLNTTASVGRLRGKFHDWRGMKVVVTYHPAYLLRNAGAKKHVWADMKMLMQAMGVQL